MNEKGEIIKNLTELIGSLGIEDEPMGLYFSDQAPEKGISPNSQTPISREDETKGQVDWEVLHNNFSCVVSKVRRARIEKKPVFFSAQNFGCMGGSFYLGYTNPNLSVQSYFVSNGIPGMFEGEHYVKTPETAQNFFDQASPPLAKKKYLIIQPLSQIIQSITPEIVIFFANSEAISGLSFLTHFVTNDMYSVRIPFGAGCTNMIAWPRKYREEEKQVAVIGGMDPSSRIYFRLNEFSFSVSFELFELMLKEWKYSFLMTKTWQKVQKRVKRSK